MRIAYFDCMSGISGDMTLGALVDVGVDFASLDRAIRSLQLPGCHLEREEVKRHGFRATKIHVRHEPEHAHRHLHHIHEIIDRAELSQRQVELSKAIFQRLAEAEAKVHGSTLEKVHFHEVGAVDSIADIVGSAVALDLLGVDAIHGSPVPTGTGSIKIAHGRVNIPAPATVELLIGIPTAESAEPFELTTPTGAAILATVVDQFGPLPSMEPERVGYGAGDREMANQANVLRVIVGNAGAVLQADQVWVLETNIDDASGEIVAHCCEKLWERGALDVYLTPIQMKKGRPAVKVTTLCRTADVSQMESVLFHETSTLGVRRWPASRHKLNRESAEVETRWGTIAGKVAHLPETGPSFAPEYESCRETAKKHKIPLQEVYEAARQAYRDGASQERRLP